MKIFNIGFDRVVVPNETTVRSAIQKPVVLSQLFKQVPTITFRSALAEHQVQWEKVKRERSTGMKELF
jgi:hypothetical protein